MNRLQPIIDHWQLWASPEDAPAGWLGPRLGPPGSYTVRSSTRGPDRWAEQLDLNFLTHSHATLQQILKGAWATKDEQDQAVHDRILLSALHHALDIEVKTRGRRLRALIDAREQAEAEARARAQRASQGLTLTDLEQDQGSLSIHDPQGQLSAPTEVTCSCCGSTVRAYMHPHWRHGCPQYFRGLPK